MKIQDSTKTGWESITDIACPITGCHGALRWAEAGYVPGYRICDCCGSHFALADCISGPIAGLRCVSRRRPSAAKIEKMKVQREKVQLAEIDAQTAWLRERTKKANEQWSNENYSGSHGRCMDVPDSSPSSASAVLMDEIVSPEHRSVIKLAWAITAELAGKSDPGHGGIVLKITRDGKYCMVYQMTHTYGSWDGWWSVDALRDCIAHRSCGDDAIKLTPAQRKDLGVWR